MSNHGTSGTLELWNSGNPPNTVDWPSGEDSSTYSLPTFKSLQLYDSYPQQSQPTELIPVKEKAAFGQIPKYLLKTAICGLVIACVIVTLMNIHLSQGFWKENNVKIIAPFQTKTIEIGSVSNASQLTISLRATSSLIALNKTRNETIFSLELSSSNFTCGHHQSSTDNLKITAQDISSLSRPVHNFHLVLLSCWKTQTDEVENIKASITSNVNETLGLLLNIEVDESSLYYVIGVGVILLLIQIILTTECFSPVITVLICFCLATVIHYVFQVQTSTALREVPDIPIIIATGSIVDQLMLVAGMMIMVNSLIRCGFYSCVAHKMKQRGYSWALCVVLFLLLSALLSGLVGRTTAIQLVVPLAICLSEVYHLAGSTMIICTVLFVNAGNVIIIYGNDVIASLHAYNFADIHTTSFGLVLCTTGIVVLALMALPILGVLGVKSSKLRQADDVTTVSVCDKYKAQRLITLEETIIPLTTADQELREFVRREYRDLKNRLNEPSDLRMDPFSQQAATSTRMADWKRITIYVLFIIPAVIFIPIVRWINWNNVGVTTVTPGVVSITAAICLAIFLGSEEKMLNSLNFSTLIYIALYRYTVQTLLTDPVLDDIGNIYDDMLSSKTTDSGLNTAHRIPFVSCVTWLSALLTALIGLEDFSPVMMNVFAEMYSSQPGIYMIAKLCQTVGSTLSGNLGLYASLSNVIARNMAKERGIALSPLEFLRLGIPVAFVTLLVANVVLLIA